MYVKFPMQMKCMYTDPELFQFEKVADVLDDFNPV